MSKNDSRYITTPEGIRFRLGSPVYSKKTGIFNTGSAHDCVSDAQGLCTHSVICYGKKSERIWKTVRTARERQGVMWKEQNADNFITALRWLHKKYDVERFRFNEVSDLATQADVNKLNEITTNIPQTVFGYIANYKLNLSYAKFLFKISQDFDVDGSTGRAIVIERPEDKPKGFYCCPKTSHVIKQCDTGGCGVCYNGKHVNIALVRH